MRNATRMYGATLKGWAVKANTSMSHANMKRRRIYKVKQKRG